MAGEAEPKIKCSFNLTSRHVSAISQEARRMGIPDGDVVRRVLDGWLDGNPVLSPLLPESHR